MDAAVKSAAGISVLGWVMAVLEPGSRGDGNDSYSVVDVVRRQGPPAMVGHGRPQEAAQLPGDGDVGDRRALAVADERAVAVVPHMCPGTPVPSPPRA